MSNSVLKVRTHLWRNGKITFLRYLLLLLFFFFVFVFDYKYNPELKNWDLGESHLCIQNIQRTFTLFSFL